MSDHDLERELAEGRVSRAELLRRAGAAGIGLGALPLLGGSALAAAPPTDGTKITLQQLTALAKKEGRLNTIALPPDWANYGEIMKTFSKTYGIPITNASPNASSADENQAVKSNKGSSKQPDVLDVGPPFAIAGKKDKLYAKYRNSQWATIPANMKDPDGFWAGDYWGVIAFGINASLVRTTPKSWADLKDSALKGRVAMNGDPRTSGSAFAGVFSAALANGGSLDNIMPGIQYFADLKKSGNFITVDATPATVANGQTPLTIDWDYLQLSYGNEFKGKLEWKVSVPSSGVFGNFYCQAISAFSKHPYAARLWQEFCYSDQGQLLWLKGFTHPARFQDLVKRGKIPASLLSKLPPAQSYKNVKFPSPAQTDKAKALVQENWQPMVLG
jgi:putative spermidine/putrescine transport system substrate-binding protein